MGIADIAIVVIVAALLFFGVRSLLKDNKNGCSDCAGGCSAHGGKGEHCSAADRMLAHANEALKR